MTVYVLTYEPYHENSTVLGVYSSLSAAQHAAPAGFNWEQGYLQGWRTTPNYDYGIFEREVDAEPIDGLE